MASITVSLFLWFVGAEKSRIFTFPRAKAARFSAHIVIAHARVDFQEHFNACLASRKEATMNVPAIAVLLLGIGFGAVVAARISAYILRTQATACIQNRTLTPASLVEWNGKDGSARGSWALPVVTTIAGAAGARPAPIRLACPVRYRGLQLGVLIGLLENLFVGRLSFVTRGRVAGRHPNRAAACARCLWCSGCCTPGCEPEGAGSTPARHPLLERMRP